MVQESITVAAAAVEHHQKLRELAQRVWKRITKGQVRVVVFGAGGSGKTTLGLGRRRGVERVPRVGAHGEL